MNAQCKIHVINSVEKVIEHLDFLVEGWEAFCKPPLNCDIPIKAYFQLLFRLATGPAEDNLIILLTSKNDKPLSYTIMFNDSQLGMPKSCVCFYFFSNGKCPTVHEESTNFVLSWARKNNYKEVHSQSFRMSGAALRFFKRKSGMTPFGILFKRKI